MMAASPLLSSYLDSCLFEMTVLVRGNVQKSGILVVVACFSRCSLMLSFGVLCCMMAGLNHHICLCFTSNPETPTDTNKWAMSKSWKRLLIKPEVLNAWCPVSAVSEPIKEPRGIIVAASISCGWPSSYRWQCPGDVRWSPLIILNMIDLRAKTVACRKRHQNVETWNRRILAG